MITGFNTDVEHNGVVYHVQTEDKGLDSPIILSLVYAGGAILASKRAPYQDLIVSGFSEAVLAERLKRQHKLICAAIYAGRIDDLRKMGMPVAPGAPGAMEEMEFEPVVTNHEAVTQDGNGAEWPDVESEAEREVASAALVDSEATDVDDARPRSPLGELPVTDQGLVVSLLDEQDFRSGASLTVRVLVSQRSGQGDKPLSNVAVSLKVLGTTFRPQIYSTKTQRNGVAIVATRIPQFTSGRAAILVRAVAQGQSTEIRRVVHPGK